MTIFATALFFTSLFGLVALFELKHIEARRGILYVPRLRRLADERAIELKQWLLSHTTHLETIPSRMVHGLAISAHVLAMQFARLAHAAAEGAHKLAEMISHKRNFQDRETTSDFLKQVSEHKNGGGLDTTDTNGHNT